MHNPSVIISVIVPTYNRSKLIRMALDALNEQTLSASIYEVIVVDDGSSDNTISVLHELKQQMPNLTFVTQQNAGPAAARNLGARLAQGTYLAFTDDDCQVDVDWLENIVDEFQKRRIIGIQGKTYTDRSKVTPLTHQIDNEHGSKAVPTCNAAFRKGVFEEVEGFDTSFPYPHNEDADLAWRIGRLGEIAFCSNVQVYHPPRLETFSKLKKRMKILESEFLLFHKNPQLYQLYRNPSPWHTIYNEVCFKHLPRKFLSSLKLFSKPILMLKSMALIIYWWNDLLFLYKNFQKTDKSLKMG